MPLSSEEIQLQQTSNKKVYFSGETVVPIPSTEPGTAGSLPPHSSKCYSQPMPKGSAHPEGATNNSAKISNNPSIKMFRDKRFDSFKTWSGTLERQLTMLRGKTPEDSAEDGNSSKRSTIDRPLPVDRYFDALEGPELETLRVCDYLLPTKIQL